MHQDTPFEDILGKTLTRIDGLEAGSDKVFFFCSDGSEYTLCHFQDCCEHVRLHDVNGDPQDLLGVPLVQAEMSTNSKDSKDHEYDDESHTWSFYKLAGKGHVTMRWLGESNGFYCEEVSFSCTKKKA